MISVLKDVMARATGNEYQDKEERLSPEILRVTRTNIIKNTTKSYDFPITEEQWLSWTEARTLIQDALPHLEPWQREFIISGNDAGDWDEMVRGFGDTIHG